MPSGSLPDWAVLLGTLLPLLGIVTTLVLGLVTQGAHRWIALVATPAVFFALAWWLVPAVWRDGNLLAAVLFLTYYVGLLVYYPVLVIVGAVIAVRKRRTWVQGHADGS